MGAILARTPEIRDKSRVFREGNRPVPLAIKNFSPDNVFYTLSSAFLSCRVPVHILGLKEVFPGYTCGLK